MADRVTPSMIACWRANYGLDARSPADAMRYWSDTCAGMAPAGAVAALGLTLQELDRMREAMNIAAGALWSLSPASIEDDDDRAAAEHARAVGMAACESILKGSA